MGKSLHTFFFRQNISGDVALRQLLKMALPSKLAGRKWYESIGSPRYVVAPMVDQSELAWRVMSRIHGAQLCYTPMFHAASFADDADTYVAAHFDMSPDSLEGKEGFDRPLVVQFCANDKDQWLKAAQKVTRHCDAVDLNLGCPQGIAKRGRYGAFLMEERSLIRDMISHLHEHLEIPVIAKIRVYPELEPTLEYAKHVVDSGAQLLTVHGRTREMKGQLAGFASWAKIKAITDTIKQRLPVFANGGMPSGEEIVPCIAETGVDGVMSAEGSLYNPMIFSPLNAAEGRRYLSNLPEEMQRAISACDDQLDGTWDKDKAAYAPSTWLADQYLAIVRTLPSTETASTAIKAHLFKLFRPVFAADKHLDLRERLGRCGSPPKADRATKLAPFEAVVVEMRRRLLNDIASGALPAHSFRPLTHDEVQRDFGGVIPYSHAQPYLRVTEVPPATSSSKRANDEVEAEAKKPRIEEEEVKEAAGPLYAGPCVESTCVNDAAARCALGACSSCCAKLSTPEKPCEHHQLKAQKAKERRDAKKQHKKAKANGASTHAGQARPVEV